MWLRESGKAQESGISPLLRAASATRVESFRKLPLGGHVRLPTRCRVFSVGETGARSGLRCSCLRRSDDELRQAEGEQVETTLIQANLGFLSDALDDGRLLGRKRAFPAAPGDNLACSGAKRKQAIANPSGARQRWSAGPELGDFDVRNAHGRTCFIPDGRRWRFCFVLFLTATTSAA